MESTSKRPSEKPSLEEHAQVNGNSDGGETLQCHIKRENEFIKQLVNTIPPNVYFSSDSLSKIRDNKRERVEKKMEEAGVTKIGTGFSNKAKNKRMKLDPGQHGNVMQFIQDLTVNESTGIRKKDIKRASQMNVGKPASIDELKARLEAKIALLRGGKVRDNSNKVEVRKTKRRLYKLRLKQKKKLLPRGDVQPATKEKKIINPTAKPVFNKEGKMVFSKFDFTESGPEAQKKGKYSGKDYKNLLKKIEKDEAKIKKLQEADVVKAEHVKDKKKWKAALERAEGIKVKDDPNLIKKAAKRQEKRKKKSKKEWNSRNEAVKQKQDTRQKKRKENIEAKKKEKMKKKIKLATKKGRLIPGFS